MIAQKDFMISPMCEDYHDALCLLGARIKKLALEKPEELRGFVEGR